MNINKMTGSIVYISMCINNMKCVLPKNVQLINKQIFTILHRNYISSTESKINESLKYCFQSYGKT